MNEQPVRVLVVGAGSIGQRHVRCFLATGRVEMAICEVHRQRLDEVAGQYDVRRTYGNLADALGDAHDVAVIATPADQHVQMALELAQAGIHLLIEKPLSTTLEGIDLLSQRAAERRLNVVVAYVLRMHPALRELKGILAQRRFGRPVQLVAAVGQHFPTYRPAYREIYYAHRASGGGAVQDCLTHTINAAQWLVGPIDRLVADVAHQCLDGVEVEDTAHVLARHGPLLASYSVNQYQAPNELTITVVCQGATLRFELHHNRLRWMERPEGPWHDAWTGHLERDDLFVAQAHAFLDAVQGQAEPVCTVEEATDTLRCNLAILASAQEHKWIRPAREAPLRPPP